jgi:hypothetical protein
MYLIDINFKNKFKLYRFNIIINIIFNLVYIYIILKFIIFFKSNES